MTNGIQLYTANHRDEIGATVKRIPVNAGDIIVDNQMLNFRLVPVGIFFRNGVDSQGLGVGIPLVAIPNPIRYNRHGDSLHIKGFPLIGVVVSIYAF